MDLLSHGLKLLVAFLQGSILGPLLFNIYFNDIFYSIAEVNMANFADDNTLTERYICFN